MNTHFSIKTGFVHLWRALLTDFNPKQGDLLSLLSPDEIHRAERLRLPLHKQRFITARGLLRKTLSLYLQIPAESITFTYGAHGKPSLLKTALQFNVSHSDDMVVYGITLENSIGIDIEKVTDDFKMAVAERFFNEQEFLQLMALPEEQRTRAFYRMWSHKEAIIKVLGLGLYAPLKDYAVSAQKQTETVSFSFENQTYHYLVQSFTAHPDYESAFAIQAPIDNILYWEWTPDLQTKQIPLPSR